MMRIIGIGILALLLFWLQHRIYEKLWKKDLHVAIRFDTRELFEGDKSKLIEVIENGKRLPINMLNVKFQTNRALQFEDDKGSLTTDQFYRNDIFQINGNERITRTLPFTAGKRGYYTIHHVDLVGTDLMMSSPFYGEVDLFSDIYVYPRPLHSRQMRLSLQKLNGEILSKRNLLEDPFEYRGIREYQPYDDMRTINWKATAKTGNLKVNQKAETSMNEVRIFINMDDTNIIKKTECVEASFQIAAAISENLLKQGIRVSLFCNGKDVENDMPMIVEASSGKGHLQNILRGLARIQVEKGSIEFTSLFEKRIMTKNQELLTIFIAPNQYTEYLELLENYQGQDGDFIWYYPVSEHGEPKVPESLKKNIRFIHIR